MGYNEFAGITLEDTRLLKKTDFIYKFFTNNKITDLQKLFYYDDNKMINYDVAKKDILEIKGFIRLLRYKYLDEDLNIESILKKKLNSADLEFDMHIRCMGFNEDETKQILNIADFNTKNSVLDLLKTVYYDERKSTIFKRKLELVINSINKKEKDTVDDYKTKLEKLRLEIKQLKENNIKRR